MAILTRKGWRLNDPNLRDRLYELLEHDHLPYSVGSRFVRLIIAIVILDVLAMILASVPEYDARFGGLFTAINRPSRARRSAAQGKIGRARGEAYGAGAGVEAGGWSSPAASRR